MDFSPSLSDATHSREGGNPKIAVGIGSPHTRGGRMKRVLALLVRGLSVPIQTHALSVRSVRNNGHHAQKLWLVGIGSCDEKVNCREVQNLE